MFLILRLNDTLVNFYKKKNTNDFGFSASYTSVCYVKIWNVDRYIYTALVMIFTYVVEKKKIQKAS